MMQVQQRNEQGQIRQWYISIIAVVVCVVAGVIVVLLINENDQLRARLNQPSDTEQTLVKLVETHNEVVNKYNNLVAEITAGELARITGSGRAVDTSDVESAVAQIEQSVLEATGSQPAAEWAGQQYLVDEVARHTERYRILSEVARGSSDPTVVEMAQTLDHELAVTYPRVPDGPKIAQLEQQVRAAPNTMAMVTTIDTGEEPSESAVETSDTGASEAAAQEQSASVDASAATENAETVVIVPDKNRGLWIALIIVIVVVSGAFIWYFRDSVRDLFFQEREEFTILDDDDDEPSNGREPIIEPFDSNDDEDENTVDGEWSEADNGDIPIATVID